MPKEISGERITLKKLAIEYAEEIFKCIDSNREHLGRFLYWVDKTKTLQDEINFIKTSDIYLGKPHYPYGIFFENKFVGSIGVLNVTIENDACEIGYWLSRGYEGRGLISDSVRILEKELFSQGFKHIELAIEPLNARSIEVAKRNKYEYKSIVNRNMHEKDIELMIFVKAR